MSGDQQTFQNAMNQGHSAAWDQDWEKAASYYHIAIDEFPENTSALTSIALALFEIQKYPEALTYYLRVTQLSPNDPVPMQKVAEVYEHMGNLDNATKAYMDVADLFARGKDIDKAIQSWSRVVTLNPEHLTAHTRLALVYERLGRTSDAMVEYLAIASLLQSQGNQAKAVQTLKHALQVVPNSKEADQALTMVLNGKALPKPIRPKGGTGPILMAQVRQAETPKSGEEDHLRLDPIQDAKQKALTMLAELLFEQEEAQGNQLRKGLATIIKGKGNEEQGNFDQSKIILHLSQAIDLQSHGEDGKAAIELERAMDAGLENSAAYFDLGFMQTKNEQLEKAVQNLKKSAQHELFGFGAHLLLGLTLYKMDSIKESSLEYLEALRIADAQSVSADQAEELIQLYEPLIEAFAMQTDQKLNKRICENISKMLVRPDWRDQILLARQQLPAQPQGSTPVPLAEMLTEATSSQLVESLAKINQLARANKLLSAMEEAYYALKYAPTYLPLHVCIGDLLVQENRVPDAVIKYTIIARSYNTRGETNRAISLLKRVSELAPMDLEARDTLIELLTSRGKISETIQEYLKLAETYYNLADLVAARKIYSRAFRFAQQSNVDRETKVLLMHRMADIDTQSLDWRNAIRVFEQIRVLDPDDRKSRDMLFDLNLRLGQSNQAMSELDNYINHLISMHRSDEALDYINTKILENQNQPALYQRLAELYRLLGRKEDAISQLEIAKEMYLQSENRPAAIEIVKAILALNPTNVNAYQRMLSELQAKE
jgi:tetratricopeptide (TPR) repeat protein